MSRMKRIGLQKLEDLWYDKGEPSSQIKVLRELALNGYLSKSELASKTGSKLPNIETMVKSLITPKNPKKPDDKLIQRHGIKKTAKREQVTFTLTEKGIKILLSSHWEDNKNNRENGIAGKPYLSVEDLLFFLIIYNGIYLNPKPNNQPHKKYKKNWKKPELSLYEVLKNYIDANQEDEDVIWKKIFVKLASEKKELDNLQKAKEAVKKAKQDVEKSIKNKLKGHIEDAKSIEETMELFK